jgi:hypothetical protein
LVLPAKIFEVKDSIDINSIAKKLSVFREEETFEMETGGAVTLVTEILDLKRAENSVEGIFSKDFVRRRYYKRGLVETPLTEEAPFWIKQVKDRKFLIVLAPSGARGVKNLLTNHVATKLSGIFFNNQSGILEKRISNESLKKLHESNPQATKLIWFDDVDIPSVQKLCLAGSSLADTKLYHDYLEHGKIWYVVFEVQKRGITVGITRNCVITLFSKSTGESFIKYILENLLGYISSD